MRRYDDDREAPPSPGETSAAADDEPSPRPVAGGRRRRLSAGWRGLGGNLRGSLLCVLSFIIFTTLATILRDVVTRVPVIEILLLRQGVTLVLVALICRGRLVAVVTSGGLGFQLARGVTATVAMTIGFTAVANLPLADSNALGFVEVLFTTLGAALVLKEQVGWRRWAATAVGLVGVSVMLSPFGSGVTVYTFMAVLAPAFGAAVSIMVRLKAGTETTETFLFWNAFVGFVVLAPVAAFVWVAPAPGDLARILAIGLLGFAAQWTYTRAYQMGEAAALAPMHFTRLIIAAVAGWFAFAEVPNVATMAGAVLVVAATVYTLKRNAARGVPPDPGPPAAR